MAARGARETEEGVEKLEDAGWIEEFQRRARGVYWRAFAATLALMVLSRAWLWWRQPGG